MTPSRRRRHPRRVALHGARVSLFVAIVVFVHLQHARSVSIRDSGSVADLPLDPVRAFFPRAVSIDDVPAGSGGRAVRDASGRRLGHVLRTSPFSDSIIGFSGPTDVLVAFGNDHRIAGLAVLASGDTRDHVQAVRDDEEFLHSFSGLTREEASHKTDVDAVSGATLTSRAIQESVIFRLGGTRTSLRFPRGITAVDARGLFPSAASLKEDETRASLWQVRGPDGAELGTILSTSPFADDIVGYQGPTESLVGFDPAGAVVGISVQQSYDNEPYVRYVREDRYFTELFDGLELGELAELDLAEAEIEGVSGATMTSLAVAKGLIRTAAESRKEEAARVRRRRVLFTFHDLGAALTILAGMVVGWTRLRSRRSARVVLQLVLVGYLGLTAGLLVSQASLVGWAQNGVPWRSAPGLVLLTAAALLLPVAGQRNLYCSHLCPHGAAQQLLRRRLPRRWRVRPGRSLRRLLHWIPALLLAWCVVVPMLSLPFSLVDVEPFDAWVLRIAGWATLAIAMVGLLSSLFVPMAYCRFGCPTGALLDFLKLDSRSGLWTPRDWLAIALLAAAACLYSA